MEINELCIGFAEPVSLLEEDFYAAFKVNAAATTRVFVENQLAANITAVFAVLEMTAIEIELEEIRQTA